MDPLRFVSIHNQINEMEENSCPLYHLVMILKAISQTPSILPEIFFLHEFSCNMLYPIEVFNLKNLIEYMVKANEMYRNFIHRNPVEFEMLVYKYNSGEEVKEYVFSNNMMLYVDVIIICYLYYIVEPCSPDHQLACDLMKMMKQKYFIKDESSNPNEITLFQIILSYPSISFGMLHYNTVPILNHIKSFSQCFSNLPNMFLISPWLASIIPVLGSDYKTPLAILVAMAVILDNDNKFSYLLYQRILVLYTSEIFPKSVKLELSKNWGIVYMIGNEYKYAPYFTINRENAIKIIILLRQNDPSLNYTLSMI